MPDAARHRVLLGSARSGAEVSLEMPFLQDGVRSAASSRAGASREMFLPHLVDLMMEGKFPAERLMTFYPLADINRAAEDATTGRDDQAGAADADARSSSSPGGGGRRSSRFIRLSILNAELATAAFSAATEGAATGRTHSASISRPGRVLVSPQLRHATRHPLPRFAGEDPASSDRLELLVLHVVAETVHRLVDLLPVGQFADPLQPARRCSDRP